MKVQRELNCLIVYNASPTFLDDNEKARKIVEFIPSGTCQQNIMQICCSDITQVTEYLSKLSIPLDFIVHFGLGRGCFWESDNVRGIKCFCSDYTLIELFSPSLAKLKTELHPKISGLYKEIDSKKCWPEKVRIARTAEDLDYVVGRCLSESFGADTETNFLNPFLRDPDPMLVCYSVAWHSDEEECWCIPTNKTLIQSSGCEFSVEDALHSAEIIFFESEQPQDWHNAHYDLLVLWELFGGRQPKNFRCDTMLLANLYHKAMKPCSLAANVQMVGLPEYKDAAKEWLAAQPRSKGVTLTFADVPSEIICPYAAMDALAVVRLFNFMKKNLGKKQWEFYFKVASEVLQCSISLCVNGYEISQDRFNYSKLSVEEQIIASYNEAINVVKQHVTSEFNIGSGPQLAELLFTKLHLPVLKKTEKGAPATSLKVLEDLILFHPFIFYLSKLKKLNKLYTSYIKGYKNALGPGSRVFPTKSNWIFNSQLKQINRTARLSASNMYGYLGTSTKGGNVLTLPAAGSMIKHFFGPKEVLELENELYSDILEELKNIDPDKYNSVIETLNKDVSKITKPPKIAKPKAPRKKKAAAVEIEETITEQPEKLDQEEMDMSCPF